MLQWSCWRSQTLELPKVCIADSSKLQRARERILKVCTFCVRAPSRQEPAVGGLWFSETSTRVAADMSQFAAPQAAAPDGDGKSRSVFAVFALVSSSAFWCSAHCQSCCSSGMLTSLYCGNRFFLKGLFFGAFFFCALFLGALLF